MRPRVDGRAADGGGDRRLAERRNPASELRRQHLLELYQRADRGVLDPGHRRPGGGAEADGDRDRLVVVEEEGRHRGAGAQGVAAGGAGEGLDRIAEVAQALDVAADRSAGDLEAPGELGAGPIAPRLEQREQVEEPARGLVHATWRVSKIADRF